MRHRLLRSALSSMLVAAVLLPATPPSGAIAATSPVLGPASDSFVTADEAAAIRFRESMGFTTDLSVVRSEAADELISPSELGGTPLTDRYVTFPGGSTAVVAMGTHVHSENHEVDPAPWLGWYSPVDVGAAQYDEFWGLYTLCTQTVC